MGKKWQIILGVELLIMLPLLFFMVFSGEEEVNDQKATVIQKEYIPPKKEKPKTKYQIYPEIEKKKEPEKVKKVVIADKQIKKEPSMGFQKIGESTYKITDRSQLSEIAVLAANEFAEERLDIWGDFDKAIGGDPITVLDECSNSYYELTPLYIYNEYAGLVQFDYINDNTIKESVVLPSSFFQSKNLSDFKNKFLPVDKQYAISLLEKAKKINFDSRNITYNSLVNPCAGTNPLSPPTSPFHSFYIDEKRYLVSSTDGKIITEQSIKKYKESVDDYIQQAELIENYKGNKL